MRDTRTESIGYMYRVPYTRTESERETRRECTSERHTHTAREREYVIKTDTAKQGVGFGDLGHV